MSKGDAAHAGQHQHGVQVRQEPPFPQTVEQRVAKLEARVAALEAPAPVAEESEVDQEKGKGKKKGKAAE